MWCSRSVLGLAGLVLAGCSGEKALEPSRAPARGCVWKEIREDIVGIRLLAQECSGTSRRLVIQGTVVWETSETANGPQRVRVIEVHRKERDASLAQAVDERFRRPLREELKEKCVIGPSKIVPVDKRKERVELSCEGATQRYFEYQPYSIKTKFLAVQSGAGRQLFDPETILLK